PPLCLFPSSRPAPPAPYTLSLHDALPICRGPRCSAPAGAPLRAVVAALALGAEWEEAWREAPREHEGLRRALQPAWDGGVSPVRSEEHTSELQSRFDLVCRLLLEKKNTRH